MCEKNGKAKKSRRRAIFCLDILGIDALVYLRSLGIADCALPILTFGGIYVRPESRSITRHARFAYTQGAGARPAARLRDHPATPPTIGSVAGGRTGRLIPR